MTQEDLSNGICTRDTLSRIERGQRRPDWHTFERLMQRLGEDPHKYYYDIITTNEKRVMDLKDELTNLIRDKKYGEAEEQISRMEQDEDFAEGVNLQFVLRMKSALAHYNHRDYKKSYEYALEALKITKPDFDEDKIDSYILSFDEIKLINTISVAHFHMTSIEKSTEIQIKLKSSLDKNYLDETEKMKTYISLLYNLTKNLGLLRRYEECIPLCDTGLEMCRIHRNSYFHPMFMYNKAYCLFYLNRNEEGEDVLRKCLALFSGLERYDELSHVKDYVREEFGIELQS